MKPPLTIATCLQCTNIPVGQDCRSILYKAFSAHGTVNKLFIETTFEFAKVYFENPIEADLAYAALNNTHPLNLRISEPFSEGFRKVQQTIVEEESSFGSSSASSSSTLVSHSKGAKSKKMSRNRSHHHQQEHVEESENDGSSRVFVDRYGRAMEILEGDNGLLYAPVDINNQEIKLLFENNDNGKLDFNELLYQEFQAYMRWSALKFIKDNQPKSKDITEKEIDSEIKSLTLSTFRDKNANRAGNRGSFQSSPPIKLSNNHTSSPISNDGNVAKEKRQRQGPPAVSTTLNDQQKQIRGFKQHAFNAEAPSNSENLRRPHETSESNNGNQIQRSLPVLPNRIRAIQQVELPENECTEVCVVHLKNESIGWVQMLKAKTTIEGIAQRLLQIRENSNKIFTPKMHLNCLAQFKNSWHRATVIAINPLTIRYIDIGRETSENIGDLILMPKELLVIPAQAVCIKLDASTQLELKDGLKLNIKPIEKLPDDTILVQVKSETNTFKVNSLKLATPSNAVIPKLVKTSKSLSTNSTLTKRRCVANYKGLNGEYQYSDALNDTQFIFTIVPLDTDHELTTKLFQLEEYEMSKTNGPIRANVGDLIICFNEVDKPVRGVVLEKDNDVYTVGQIDYGIVIKVKEVYRLPEDIAHIEEFACIGNVTADTLKLIQKIESNVISCVVTDSGLVTLKTCNKDVIEITTTSWLPQSSESVEEQMVYFTLPPFINLKETDSVKLFCLEESTLFVRSRNISELLRGIKKELKVQEHGNICLKLPPKVGQLILAKHSKFGYIRGKILSIDGENAKVLYVDVQETETAAISTLRNFNTALSQHPPAVIPLQLKGHVNKPYSEKELKFIEELKNNQTIFTVTFDDEKNIDLLLEPNEESLSELLANLNKPVKTSQPNEKICIQMVAEEQMQVGTYTLTILNCDLLDQGIIALCKSADAVSNIEKVEKIIENGLKNVKANFYNPGMNELCIAKFEGDWYRGVCIEINNGKYTIQYIDYGNSSENLSPEDIRPIDKEAVNVPAVAIMCQINEFPASVSTEVMSSLKEIIIQTEDILVKVMSYQERMYTIEIPEISKYL